MRVFLLDGAAVEDCEDLHTRLARGLGFPDWYGRNLDALYDCLTDLPAGTELVIRHFDGLESALGGRYAGLIRRVLNDAAAEGNFSWREE